LGAWDFSAVTVNKVSTEDPERKDWLSYNSFAFKTLAGTDIMQGVELTCHKGFE
jgi:hypothetical protein